MEVKYEGKPLESLNMIIGIEAEDWIYLDTMYSLAAKIDFVNPFRGSN